MYNIGNYRVIGLCKMTVQQAALIAVRNLMPIVLGLFFRDNTDSSWVRKYSHLFLDVCLCIGGCAQALV